MTLSLIKIVKSTTVDGPGFRTSIYAAGCKHACPGCHNPQSWNIATGNPTPIEQIVQTIAQNKFENVTFTGGDPFFQAKAFTMLAKQIKEKQHKNIWCYTGYTYEELLQQEEHVELLKHIDILVDGKYKEQLRNPNLKFRGSDNQRFVNVQASLSEKRTILANI